MCILSTHCFMAVRPRASTSDRVSILTHFTFTAEIHSGHQVYYWVTNIKVFNCTHIPSLFTLLQYYHLCWLAHIHCMIGKRILKGILCRELATSKRAWGCPPPNSHKAILEEENVFRCNHCNWDCQSCVDLYRHCTTNSNWIKTSQANSVVSWHWVCCL